MKKAIIPLLMVLFVIGIAIFLLRDNDHPAIQDKMPTSNLRILDGGSIDPEVLAYRNVLLKDYASYIEVVDYYQIEEVLKESDFNHHDYLAVVIENDYCPGNLDGIYDVVVSNNKAIVKVNVHDMSETCPIDYEMFFVELDKNKLKDNFEIEVKYEKKK